MKITTDALVIWEVKTGEADRVLTLLSERGVLTAYARGSLRPKGKLTAPTAMLSYSNFELSSGKNMYNVVDATPQRKFMHLFSDAENYALAIYFCELLRLLAPVEDETEEAGSFLRLMLNSLHLLDSGSKPAWQVKAVFELTAMTLAGYMPSVNCCAACGQQGSGGVFFDALSASWLCSSCAERLGRSLNAPATAMTAMDYIVENEPKRAYAFTLADEVQQRFCGCCEEFVRSHIDHRLPTLEFYRSIAQ
ncbi:MAG: DNA repair protein RecO [Oscillospiraceae bacterium]|nr:DNA repair protein RecO [Oscillospiraceae bacterium]